MLTQIEHNNKEYKCNLYSLLIFIITGEKTREA